MQGEKDLRNTVKISNKDAWSPRREGATKSYWLKIHKTDESHRTIDPRSSSNSKQSNYIGNSWAHRCKVAKPKEKVVKQPEEKACSYFKRGSSASGRRDSGRNTGSHRVNE